MIGTNFGPYRIDDKLGQGGMGVVYKAFDTTLQRPVAIKMIQTAHKESTGDGSEARFMREARAASRLTHPAIVTIYHFGVEGDTEYIVMEYVEGKTLRKIIHDEPMPLDQLYDIAIQTAEGLAAAHEANIVHRDMKADNVMVSSKGQVKILDFGLAKLKDPLQPATDDGETIFQTQAGLAVGTASHMSPEQAMGREVDGKSDVFSFGVVLYHMACGKVPFQGPNPTITMARIIEGEVTPLRHHNPNVPEPLEELILRCLQKNRMFRPTSAEVVQTLKALRDSSKVPTGMPAAAAVAAAPSSQASAGRLPTPAPSPAMPAGSPVGAVPVVIVGMQTPQGLQMIPAQGVEVTPTPMPAMAPRPPAPPAVKPRPRALYWPVRSVRSVVSFAFIAYALAFFLLFVGDAEPPSHRVVSTVKGYAQVAALTRPLLNYVHHVLTFNTIYVSKPAPPPDANGDTGTDAGGGKTSKETKRHSAEAKDKAKQDAAAAAATPPLEPTRWDFMAVILGVVVLIARTVVVSPMQSLEDRLRRGAR